MGRNAEPERTMEAIPRTVGGDLRPVGGKVGPLGAILRTVGGDLAVMCST